MERINKNSFMFNTEIQVAIICNKKIKKNKKNLQVHNHSYPNSIGDLTAIIHKFEMVTKWNLFSDKKKVFKEKTERKKK